MMDSKGRSAPTEVTRFVAEWIGARQKAGASYMDIANMIGVTKTQVINVHSGTRGVGSTMEEKFARLEFGGSVDALRDAARKAAKSQPQATPPNNLRDAIDFLRGRGGVSEEAADRARGVAHELGDLAVETWIAVLRDITETRGAREGPPPSEPRSAPRTHRSR